MSDKLDLVISCARSSRLDARTLIRAADALNLGDRLFQQRLNDLAKVDGWVDAALMIAEAAHDGPLAIDMRIGLDGGQPSAQIGDEPRFFAPTLAYAIIGAAAQHHKIIIEQDAL